MNDHIQQTMSRNQTADYPVSLMYALIGNDVCNGHVDDYVNHMTTPDEMRTSVLGTLDYLEKTLPQGSSVTLMGLADGLFVPVCFSKRVSAPVGSDVENITHLRSNAAPP